MTHKARSSYGANGQPLRDLSEGASAPDFGSNVRSIVTDTGIQMETVCAADFDGKPVPPRQWLCKDAIPHPNVTNLSGDGGVGKTLLALQLGTSLSTRTTWLGLECTQGPFLYIGAEDELDELHRRLDAMRIELGYSWGDFADIHLKSFAGEDALVATFDRAEQKMQATKLLRKIETKIRDLGAICCVLDTTADVFGGDEISRTQVRQFVALLRGLCLRTQASVLLLSHPSVAGITSGTGTSGSTAWNNSVRSRLYLVEDKDNPDARLLHFKKLNYGPKGKPMRLLYRNGIFVTDDGKASASAQINAEVIFLATLDAFTKQGRHVSSAPSANYAPKIFADDPNCQLDKKALTTAMNSLFGRGEIKIEMFGPPSRQVSRIVRATTTQK
jgi:RecA-family ATPase